MDETYDELKKRHERELREWVLSALRDCPSTNLAARRAGINAGTMWRLAKKYGGDNE
jgi:hypothetical protein